MGLRIKSTRRIRTYHSNSKRTGKRALTRKTLRFGMKTVLRRLLPATRRAKLRVLSRTLLLLLMTKTTTTIKAVEEEVPEALSLVFYSASQFRSLVSYITKGRTD